MSKQVLSTGGWEANPSQLQAAQVALKAQKEGKSKQEVLKAVKDAAEETAKQEASIAITRRYLLAQVNRTNMAGRFNELSAIELLDIVASTSIEGNPLTFDEYTAQLELIAKSTN